MKERRKEGWKRKKQDVTTPVVIYIYIYIYMEERRKEEGREEGQVTVVPSEYRGRFIGFVYGGSARISAVGGAGCLERD